MKAIKFIELCFRVKDDYILHNTALVVPDFGTVILLLNICGMNNLNSVIDVSSRQISIRKKSFAFKSSFHCKVRANDSRTLSIKCSLPKELRNGDFVSWPFRPYSKYLPLTFMLQFRKGRGFIRITNPISRDLTIKPNTPLGCVSFELMRNLSDSINIIAHLHQDMDGCNAMCSQFMSDCLIHQSMRNAPDRKVSHTCKDPFEHKPQSHDYPTCPESMHIHRNKKDHNFSNKSVWWLSTWANDKGLL